MRSLWTVASAAVMFSAVSLPTAQAGIFEFSISGSYNRSNYSEESYAWTRRWGTALGYHFTELSGIEMSFSDAFERTSIDGYQDTSIRDRVYALMWVQALTPRAAAIQPYFKLGVGQLNRDATGTYFGGLVAPPSRIDEVTVIASAGLRLFFTKMTAFKMEGTTYLTGGSLATWHDNIALSVGLSLYF